MTRRADIAQRNAQIVARYRAGKSLNHLARVFGLSQSRVWSIVAWSVHPDEAPHRRALMAPRHRGGRRAIWPDCPPEYRDEYLQLRRVIGSAAARDQLMRLARRGDGPKQARAR